MSKSDRYDPLASGKMSALRNRIDDIEPYLYEQRFVSKEIDDGDRHTPRYLKRQGAIFVVDTIYRENSKGKQRAHNLYEWVEPVRQKLIDYYENRDVLPCGHRPHIWNAPAFDGLMCQVCMDHGIRTSVDKETVRELL